MSFSQFLTYVTLPLLLGEKYTDTINYYQYNNIVQRWANSCEILTKINSFFKLTQNHINSTVKTSR